MKDIPVRKLQSSCSSIRPNEQFRLIQLEDHLKEEEFVHDTHRPDFYFLLFFESGSGEHIVDFRPFTLTPSTVFVLRPGQVHSLTINEQSKGYIIQFNSDLFDSGELTNVQLLKKLSRSAFLAFSSEAFTKLSSLLHSIAIELANKEKDFHKSIRAYVELLLIELNRKYPRTQKDGVSSFELNTFDTISNLLDAHVLEHKRVSDYAQMMNLSTFQLNKITKTVQGKTFSEVLNERKILESKRFLQATSVQIKEIAFKLGYDDVSYFSRYFKKHTGMTPVEFRRNFK